VPLPVAHRTAIGAGATQKQRATWWWPCCSRNRDTPSILDASDRISATVTGSALRPMVRSIARLGCFALCVAGDDRIATSALEIRVFSRARARRAWCSAA
jgi:hypothetical protein